MPSAGTRESVHLQYRQEHFIDFILVHGLGGYHGNLAFYPRIDDEVLSGGLGNGIDQYPDIRVIEVQGRRFRTHGGLFQRLHRLRGRLHASLRLGIIGLVILLNYLFGGDIFLSFILSLNAGGIQHCEQSQLDRK
jgi:hypothetical protein